MLKTNKALGQSLYYSRRHRVPSQEVLRGLGSPGRKMSSAGLCAPGNQTEREIEREREREREREKEGHGNPSLWWNKSGLLNSVWVYIPYYKVASSDKDQKTRLYKLPRKQGVSSVQSLSRV